MYKAMLFFSFFIFSSFLVSKEKNSDKNKPHIQNISIAIPGFASYDIPPNEQIKITFFKTLASFGQAFTPVTPAGSDRLEINEPGNYLLSFHTDFSVTPADGAFLTTQFYFNNKPVGPIDVKLYESFGTDSFTLDYILTVKKPGFLEVRITNNPDDNLPPPRIANVILTANSTTLTAIKFPNPVLSAINQGGANFNLVSFPNSEQLMTFRFPDTLSDRGVIDFNCSRPDEIILKEKGKYFVIYDSASRRNVPGTTLQFFLNGKKINSVDYQAFGSVQAQSPYSLQSIVNVTKENSIFNVGFHVTDKLNLQNFSEIAVVPLTACINVIYLGQ